jgi:putative nucleotidyltransferase with HDIG domain
LNYYCVMETGINREEALTLVQEHLNNDHLVNHSLASEAVLRALARHLGEDEELWGLTGLLHDLDAEAQPDLAVHTTQTAAILTKRGVHPDIIEAIELHNLSAHLGRGRTAPLHHGLAAGETITGLIVAAALVNPARKLAAVKPKSVKKRYKEKAFARGADRAIIAECELLGISVPDFCELSLAAMQDIAGDIGL